MTDTKMYEYKRDDIISLDEIYIIQGLGEGNWWDFVDGDERSNLVVILTDIKISVSVTKEFTPEEK